ncbi:MAG: hypothetical protein VZQ55_07275 [Ruminococcus sp.]|jgi:hypothetical protein|nr:hypothetical protein [Ruminococcus sp.]
MNYNEWAEEYIKDAENLKKVIDKYYKLIKDGKATNEENVNSIIASYRYIYYDLINTAKMLKERAKESVNAA